MDKDKCLFSSEAAPKVEARKAERAKMKEIGAYAAITGILESSKKSKAQDVLKAFNAGFETDFLDSDKKTQWAMIRALQLGLLAGSMYPAQARKAMLSDAGKHGGEQRRKPYDAIKQWALRAAVDMRGSDRQKATRLAAMLPAHLADISENPERLIYDALRQTIS